ncbi:MAG: phage Gp37/Gp68 family protein [Candidatus Eisenbacteria bacterium]|nr:phage Gp37/Gp68 family protein [Candidatus Eisenbacteria bacterium]
MAGMSKIEWTEATWNPVTGCTKISSGCKHCYAETMAKRLKAMGNPRYARGFTPVLHYDLVEHPLHWKKPRTIFVNSMSDLFHDDVPDSFIGSIFKTMGEASWHRFQILTKRSARLREVAPSLPWHSNIWMGVSVEDRLTKHRIEDLRATPAPIKFLSLEPLLEDLGHLDLSGIAWIIVGGESGPGARPMDPLWVRRIRDICSQSDTPFFFKQWGGVVKKKTGRNLDGRTWDGMPDEALTIAST